MGLTVAEVGADTDECCFGHRCYVRFLEAVRGRSGPYGSRGHRAAGQSARTRCGLSQRRAAGGQLAFPVICTVNGQTLHNHHYGNTLKSGDMVLCDTGAETALRYGGDLSSTFPVDATFTPRQREILSNADHFWQEPVLV